jgi:hypothetical protein
LEEVLIKSYTVTVVTLIIALAVVPLIGALMAMVLGIIRTFAPNAGNRPEVRAVMRAFDRVSTRLGISLDPVDQEEAARDAYAFDAHQTCGEAKAATTARDIYGIWSVGDDSPADRRSLERRQDQRRLATRRIHRENAGRRDDERRQAERRDSIHPA